MALDILAHQRKATTPPILSWSSLVLRDGNWRQKWKSPLLESASSLGWVKPLLLCCPVLCNVLVYKYFHVFIVEGCSLVTGSVVVSVFLNEFAAGPTQPWLLLCFAKHCNATFGDAGCDRHIIPISYSAQGNIPCLLAVSLLAMPVQCHCCSRTWSGGTKRSKLEAAKPSLGLAAA